jgi:hypothetical protein
MRHIQLLKKLLIPVQFQYSTNRKKYKDSVFGGRDKSRKVEL